MIVEKEWINGIADYFDEIEDEHNENLNTVTFRLKSKDVLVGQVTVENSEDWKYWSKHDSSNLLRDLKLNKDDTSTKSFIISGINLNNRFAQVDEDNSTFKNYLIIGAQYLLNIVSSKEPIIE